MLRKIVLFLLLIKASATSSEIVSTKSGSVEGYVKRSFSNHSFLAFEGIPYAKPPIGERRFQPPEPIGTWSGNPLQANFLKECPQLLNNLTIGEEDCLYLNIYVPQTLNTSANYDVIVHIHGGGFMLGSSHEYASPHYIIDSGVIFVTFNYRLGILGFLSFQDEILPGNNGLKDQVVVLKWVHENIASFGGNPNSITISGVSAGGASVHLHFFSSLSQGLFQKGFSRSGCALNPWVFQKRAAQKAQRVVHDLNCTKPSNEESLNCLKTKPFRELVEAGKVFDKYRYIPIAPFGPVVEAGEKAFLSKEPIQLLRDGQFQDLPWMASFVRDDAEGLLDVFTDNLEALNLQWEDAAPFLLHFSDVAAEEKWGSLAEQIKKRYFGKHGKISNETFRSLVKLMTDRITVSGVAESIKLQSRRANSSVFLYELSYTGDSKQTVVHYDDNKYFYYHDTDHLTQNELVMKDVLMEVLVTFAKTGQPVVEGVDWAAAKNGKITLLHFGGYQREDFKVEVDDNLGNLEFWNSLHL